MGGLSAAQQLTAWIRCPRPSEQASLRLFCLPFGGGGAQTYREWPAALGPDIEVWHAQLPGREARHREPPLTSLPPLVQPLAAAMLPYLDRPYAIFGHSMGALIAFELARLFRRLGAPAPTYLFVSARRAPHLPDWRPPLHTLPDADLVDHLNQRYNGLPRAVLESADLLRMFTPLIRADLTLTELYDFVPEEALPCPISVFGGLDDSAVTRDDLTAWGEHTASSFTLRMTPGGHFFLQTVRPWLLAAIVADLRQAACVGG